jgi:hypothetical protein
MQNLQLKNDGRSITRVSKKVIWDSASDDMKEFIKTMITNFNAKPTSIKVDDKEWMTPN